MKAWLAGSAVAWMIAAAGLLGLTWSGFSPSQRDAMRAELEAELAATLPHPMIFQRPILTVHVTAKWFGPDHRVRWYTLPADVVGRALKYLFPTPLLVLLARVLLISSIQATLASAVLWVTIRGACAGAGGSGGMTVPLPGKPAADRSR